MNVQELCENKTYSPDSVEVALVFNPEKAKVYCTNFVSFTSVVSLILCVIAQSTVREKMSAVHLTTTPCEPNAANRKTEHRKSFIFGEFNPCSNNIVYCTCRLEVVRTFLFIFMSIFSSRVDKITQNVLAAGNFATNLCCPLFAT